MTPKQWQVACVGTCALVTLWETAPQRAGECEPLAGRWIGEVLGNDAIIVARSLLRRGLGVKCIVLNPTDSDLARLHEDLGSDRVVGIGTERGELTRSLGLEDLAGLRTWILSRVPTPRGILGEVSADFVYTDYYSELAVYLRESFGGCELPIMVNLSDLRDPSKLPEMSFRPTVVQASIGNKQTTGQAKEIARQLQHATGASSAFVTQGPEGAVMACETRNVWHSKSSSRARGSMLGAGALFSSEVIDGIVEGLRGRTLLQRCVERTASRITRLVSS